MFCSLASVKKKKKSKQKNSGKPSARIQELREYMEWSQTQLAIFCDFKREYISQSERNLYDMQWSSLEQIIEKGFNISEKDFFDYGNIPESLKKRKEYEIKKKSKRSL